MKAVAACNALDKTIALFLVYIARFITQLKILPNQLPTHFIVIVEFNGHNSLWGSKTISDKGKKLEDFFSQEGLCIFNDGTHTYLHFDRKHDYTMVTLSTILTEVQMSSLEQCWLYINTTEM